jgi:NAD(P)-dependent dehydrogenase (short-subunit alcohol dehydrogenase family)
MRLKGKIAIVTGAGTGIGEAISHKFGREGAKLMLAGLPSDPVQDVAAAIVTDGGAAATYLGDLSEADHARTCVELAIQTYGRLDILVSNAGVFIANARTDAYRIEDFERTLRSNVWTAFLMTKFALPHLRRTRGNIVFTGSEAGFPARLHERCGAGAGALWRARQLRLSGSDRYGLDARQRQPDPTCRTGNDRRHGAARAARHPRGDGEHLRVSGLR